MALDNLAGYPMRDHQPVKQVVLPLPVLPARRLELAQDKVVGQSQQYHQDKPAGQPRIIGKSKQVGPQGQRFGELV